MIFDLKKYFKECITLVDTSLNQYLPGEEVHPSKVHKAMRYSLFAGGKRIRPILCMASAEACGGEKENVLPVACALEMIHTFSLIHDDLPAMDDDNFRRGVPTNHKVFGEATAILAGDALMTEAFIVLGRIKNGCIDPMRVLEIIEDIAYATGSLGMVGGQIVDMESEGKKLDFESLAQLHSLKTGRLITVSVTSGAKLVSNDSQKIKKLEDYGRAIGLAFQIADDILDIEGGKDLGKDIGSDVGKGKATYPALIGLDAAKREAVAQMTEALEALEGFDDRANPLREIARFIVERKK